MLRVYERLQREHPRRDPRFRLEHCTFINDSLIQRIRALGAIPTPFSAYVYYHGEKIREYGAERLEHMFALRSFLDAGIRVPPGSDYPPGPFEPMMALQSSVTRTDQRGMSGDRGSASHRGSVAHADAPRRLRVVRRTRKRLNRARQAGGSGCAGRDPLREDPMPLSKSQSNAQWSAVDGSMKLDKEVPYRARSWRSYS